MYIVTIILFFALVRTDTPRFYILSGQEEKAKLAISKIYQTGDDSVKLRNIYLAERAAAGVDDKDREDGAGGVTTKQALWTDEKYVRSSWTAILIMAF